MAQNGLSHDLSVLSPAAEDGTFTEAVSFMVNCNDQDEVDCYRARLLDGGQESQCGWLKDPFGVS